MSIPEYVLRNRSVVWFILALFIVGGVWAFLQMGKKEDSTFVLKSAVVTCQYDGATPYEVERLISEPLAREMQSMRNIKKVTSESYYGLSKVVVELESSTRAKEIPQLWDELRRKVMNMQPQLPAGAGPIVVNDDFGDVYGLYYGLAADEGFAWQDLRDWAQEIKRRVVTVAGVEKVVLFGEQKPVINLYITRSTLANFSITPDMIVSMMSQQNAVVNSGQIAAGELSVRVLETGAYATKDDIANQLLTAPDGRQFRLGDIARIEWDYLTPPSALMYVDGQPAIGIGISTSSQADVVAVGQQVREVLNALSQDMPVGIELVSLYPEDEIAQQANLSFMLNLAESLIIVILVIMLAMGLRSGSLIGSSLLFTIGGTMLLMYLFGEGINRTSLAGFIIAMGMLVDNAIVVTDNAQKSLFAGVSLRDGFIRGADGPKWGLLGATLIAILSFLPLYLAPSAVAEIIKPLFVVIALSLLLSWVLAMTQVPLFGIYMLSSQPTIRLQQHLGWFEGVLRRMLAHRWTVVCCSVVLLLVSIAAMRYMPHNFFPQLDKPYFRADVILPEGYDIGATQQNLDTMSRWLLQHPDVKRVSTTAGATPPRYYLASSSYASRPNYGNILVEVKNKRLTEDVKSQFDKFVADSCPDVWLRSSLFKLSPVPDATIEFGFLGDNVDTLLNLTQQVEHLMRQDNRATNIRNSWGNLIPTWMPVYSQIKGQRIGVSRSRMVEWLTLATQGYRMGELRRGDEFVPILLKDDDVAGRNLSNLQSMPIFSQSGKVYSIEQASTRFDFDYSTAVVEQYNRQRVMKAQCDPVEGVNTQLLFDDLLRKVKSEVRIPDGYALKVFGEQESQAESNAALAANMPLALVLIFIVLLLLFGNYRDPIVILLMTPLIFIGVAGGLIFTGNSFDFFSLLGLIGLVGMNIKNAVILLSSINDLRTLGVPPIEAVVEAAKQRIVPVVLASMTTILALIPLLFDSLFAGMAATIMGGLLVATILTIGVLPVVYALFYKIKITVKD
ncbi:MAG: efflux RND transporter permease subunit [Alistipes sp.]|nr:efflux RND transporter permease subunit [Alistipes sp.]